MTLKEYIQSTRPLLISVIQTKCRNCELSDDDIEEWISSDEDLYALADAAGVEDL